METENEKVRQVYKNLTGMYYFVTFVGAAMMGLLAVNTTLGHIVGMFLSMVSAFCFLLGGITLQRREGYAERKQRSGE